MTVLMLLTLEAQKECDRLTDALPDGFHFIASYEESKASYPKREYVSINMQTWSGSVLTLGYLTNLKDLHGLILRSSYTSHYREKLLSLVRG